VNNERLWAPWRLEYVSGNQAAAKPLPEPTGCLPDADVDCFLCQAAAEYDSPAVDRRLLVAKRAADVVVVLNRYPYNNGHVLIAPRRHVAELAGLTRDEHLACIDRFAELMQIYRDELNAEGFNIGLNLGRAAGAGLPGHLHWHLVPRWAGDNNFMPVLAGTRVIPQSLDALWELLVSALHRRGHSPGLNRGP
jgi:ATP adenylyltransferase